MFLGTLILILISPYYPWQLFLPFSFIYILFCSIRVSYGWSVPRCGWCIENGIFRYLHEICSPSVIHKNIKSANILLDAELNPHLSDSGLANFIPNADEVIIELLYISCIYMNYPCFLQNLLKSITFYQFL